MRVVRLKRVKWDVLAIREDSGGIPTFDGLQGQNGEKQMLALLLEQVPVYGPPMQNKELCKPLTRNGEGLWEFRKQPRRGPKPRVLWFPDGANVIVCAVGFVKRDKIAESTINVAQRFRTEYLATKGHFRIEEL